MKTMKTIKTIKSWTYYIPEGTQIWRTMRDDLVADHQGHLMLAENR